MNHLGPEDDVVRRLQDLVRVAVDDGRPPRNAERNAPLAGAALGVDITAATRAVPGRPAPVCVGLGCRRTARGDFRGDGRDLAVGRVDDEPGAVVDGDEVVEPVDRHGDGDALLRFTAAEERRELHGALQALLDRLLQLLRRDVRHPAAGPLVGPLHRRIGFGARVEVARDVRVAPRGPGRREALLDARRDEGLDLRGARQGFDASAQFADRRVGGLRRLSFDDDRRQARGRRGYKDRDPRRSG